MNSSRIKLLVMDVDGTLTDGKIYFSGQGECFKAFSAKDGYVLARIREWNVTPVILTGRRSDIVSMRAASLGITEVYQGIEDKLSKLTDILSAHGLPFSETAYIGDDLNDLDCLLQCGVSAAPSDAVAEVRAAVDYVCQAKGGEGAVREFIDYLQQQQLIGHHDH